MVMTLSFVSYLTSGVDKVFYVAQAGIELPVVLFSFRPESWDYRHADTPLSSDTFNFKHCVHTPRDRQKAGQSGKTSHHTGTFLK